MIYADLKLGQNLLGWILAAVVPSFNLGAPWPFGPLQAYPAVKYVFLRDFHGKTFRTDVLLGTDVPEDKRAELAIDQIMAADDALDSLLQWPGQAA